MGSEVVAAPPATPLTLTAFRVWERERQPETAEASLTVYSQGASAEAINCIYDASAYFFGAFLLVRMGHLPCVAAGLKLELRSAAEYL